MRKSLAPLAFALALTACGAPAPKPPPDIDATHTAQARNRPDAWVPSGFKSWEDATAYRFAEGRACSYSTVEACAHYEVVARYGCPDSLYVEVAFLDEGGTQVDWSNDTASGLGAGEKAILEFVSFESTASKVKVTDISCH